MNIVIIITHIIAFLLGFLYKKKNKKKKRKITDEEYNFNRASNW